MLDSLCIIFMTAYFKHSDGTYNFVPESTTRIEVKTKDFRTLLFRVNRDKWFGNVNGKIFYSTLDSYTELVCDKANSEPLPEQAYKERAIIIE